VSPFDPPPAEPINPYAAPRAEAGAPVADLAGDLAEAEAIRRAHLGHEASVQSIGSLHLLSAFFAAIGVIGAGALLVQTAEEGARLRALAMLVGYVASMGVNFALGLGLRRLQPWARWTEAAFTSLGAAFSLLVILVALITGMMPLLLIYGVGLLILGYILYLLLSRKGTVVFSPQYRTIVEKTPHLKYRTSLILKIGLVFLIAVVIIAVTSVLYVGRIATLPGP
jgi:hypothetical protein